MIFKFKKKGKELVDDLMDDALEGVLYELDKNGIAQGRKADEWVWSDNRLFESFLVSFGQKGMKFQGVAVRPTYDIQGKTNNHWTTFQTRVHPKWEDAKNELVRYIKAYHQSKHN